MGDGALWACSLYGLDIMVVWDNVAIGVVKWTQCWLRGRLNGLCGELGIFCLSMVGIAGYKLFVVTVHFF